MNFIHTVEIKCNKNIDKIQIKANGNYVIIYGFFSVTFALWQNNFLFVIGQGWNLLFFDQLQTIYCVDIYAIAAHVDLTWFVTSNLT